MSDEVDIANDIAEIHLQELIAKAKVPMATGYAGECDDCGDFTPRLVDGLCSPCRDFNARTRRDRNIFK